ncbi:hypothetical protein VTN02DRAFT_6649 [Thermoascus thermophilus]
MAKQLHENAVKAPGQPNDLGLAFDVAASHAPVTAKRRPATTVDRDVEKPGVGRANVAASREAPFGTRGHAEGFRNYTVLQQHTLFWDRDGDGIITPRDTFVGFRELGFNLFFSLLAVLVINLNFSYPTRLAYSWWPDPLFRVYVGGMHKAKHGSDSNVFDTEGRFVPQMFENLFAQYDRDGDGTLTLRETFDLIRGRRCAVDPFGWGAAFFEWGTTWLLIQREGKMYKEDVRRVYDGSLFWHIKEQRKTKAGWRQGFGIGGDGFFGATKMSSV